MNENISLAFSKTQNGTTAVISISSEGGEHISLPIASATGGETEDAFFAAISEAIAAYRASKGF